MYALPHEGETEHTALVKHLEPYAYHPSSNTPGLWTRKVRQTNLTLVVDVLELNILEYIMIYTWK